MSPSKNSIAPWTSSLMILGAKRVSNHMRDMFVQKDTRIHPTCADYSHLPGLGDNPFLRMVSDALLSSQETLYILHVSRFSPNRNLLDLAEPVHVLSQYFAGTLAGIRVSRPQLYARHALRSRMSARLVYWTSSMVYRPKSVTRRLQSSRKHLLVT